jgi:hypothetical protein
MLECEEGNSGGIAGVNNNQTTRRSMETAEIR